MLEYRNFHIGLLSVLLLTAPLTAGVVIHPDVNGLGALAVNVGESMTFDLLATWDGLDSSSVDGVGLYLEVHDSNGLGVSATSPTVGAIDVLGAGLPWNFQTSDEFVGTTRRFADANSAASIVLSAVPLRIATVELDATHLTNPGQYSLRFSHDGGNIGVTQFVDGGAQITPLVDGANGQVSALTASIDIQVSSVPEPGVCWYFGCVGALCLAVRWLRRQRSIASH